MTSHSPGQGASMSTTSLTRVAAVAAAVVILAIIIGCMSFSIGGGDTVREETSSEIVPVGYGPGETIFEQHDRVKVPPNGVLDVYYPVPFYSRPNLTIDGGEGRVKIV